MSNGRQKHKGKKRPRSWHHRYNTPDRAFARAARKLDRAMNAWRKSRTDIDAPTVRSWASPADVPVFPEPKS